MSPGKFRTRTRNTQKLAPAIALATALLLASCGTSAPTADDTDDDTSDEGGTDSEAGGPEEGDLTLDEVYAELDGLEGDERHSRLVELAQAESNDFTLYLTTNERESGPWLESFTDLYDIDIEIYRASSTDLLQRLAQEADAEFQEGADAVLTNAPEMVTLDHEYEIFQPLDTPVTDELAPEVVFDNWAGYNANAFVVFWNTSNVSEEEAPTTHEEVFTNFEGRLLIEATDWEWMATLITEWFIPEMGMTEDEAIELFRTGARAAAIARGHTFVNTQVISGEYDISATSYINRSQGDVDEGAPVAWGVEPLVVRPAGGGVHKYADRPATALLFLEHMFTTVQDSFPEQNFIPLNTSVEGSPVADLTVVYQDSEKMVAERDKWEPLWDEIIQEAGYGFIEESE